jgi:thiol-disulfide isomerase/thioredoxin
MKPVIYIIFSAIISLQLVFAVCAWSDPSNDLWFSQVGEVKKVKLYFFWSKKCPHCQKAKPFIENLAASNDWMELGSYELSEHQENADFYVRLSKKIGNLNFGVPAFAFCEQIVVGFFDNETTGAKLQSELLACREELHGVKEKLSSDQGSQVSLPIFGDLDSTQVSLPIFTIAIAGLDAFNPCAFFVLLLLLSLLVDAKNRRKMLLIGGIFVFFSGFIYFIFMAAWLNAFLYVGELKFVTAIAALIAIGVGSINIKDYFFFKQGVSLSIPESVKPNLYKRIRGLVNASQLSVMLFGTAVLAITANAYELLCTSGFPMIFTRVLTLKQLPIEDYYLYLIFYNVIYVIPLTIIVLIFVFTLGSRKLTKKEGRILKLVSGLMMFFLGIVLLFKPILLNNFMVSLGMLLLAIFLSFLIQALGKFEIMKTKD